MKVKPIDLTEHPTTCDTCKKRITEGFKVAAETDQIIRRIQTKPLHSLQQTLQILRHHLDHAKIQRTSEEHRTTNKREDTDANSQSSSTTFPNKQIQNSAFCRMTVVLKDPRAM